MIVIAAVLVFGAISLGFAYGCWYLLRLSLSDEYSGETLSVIGLQVLSVLYAFTAFYFASFAFRAVVYGVS